MNISEQLGKLKILSSVVTGFEKLDTNTLSVNEDKQLYVLSGNYAPAIHTHDYVLISSDSQTISSKISIVGDISASNLKGLAFKDEDDLNLKDLAKKDYSDISDSVSGTIESYNNVAFNNKLALSSYSVLTAQLTTILSVNVKKLDTPETSSFASYQIEQNGNKVGETINIPKDFLVKQANISTCLSDDIPVQGYVKGDVYIEFVINSKEGTSQESHLYLKVKDFITPYNAVNSDTINMSINSSNQISASVVKDYALKNEVSSTEQLSEEFLKYTKTDHTHNIICADASFTSEIGIPLTSMVMTQFDVTYEYQDGRPNTGTYYWISDIGKRIEFNANGGYSIETVRIIKSGEKIGTLPLANKVGYTFMGWFTEKDEGTQITKNTIPSSNATYYAHWSNYMFFGTTNASHEHFTDTNEISGQIDDDSGEQVGILKCGKGEDVENSQITYLVGDENANVTSINNYAFAQSNSLSSVNCSGVKKIDCYAFFNNGKLKTINLPNTLSIGVGAFCYCPMETLDITNAKYIGYDEDNMAEAFEGPFMQCNNLKTLNIPNVLCIGIGSFSECSNLTCIVLSSITDIGDFAFYGCSNLSTITLPADNGNFKLLTKNNELSNSGIVLIDDKTHVVLWGSIAECENVVLSDDITRIGNYAFAKCNQLTSITCHGLSSIANGAFANCNNLSSVILDNMTEDNMVSLDTAWAFGWKNMRDYAVSVYVPYLIKDKIASTVNWKGAIDNDVITLVRTGCTKFNSVGGAHEHFTDVTEIGNETDINCLCGETVSKNDIIDIYADQYSMLSSLNNSAFQNRSNLTSINCYNIVEIQAVAIKNCDNLKDAIFENVLSIHKSAFESCSQLSNVICPKVSFLGENAFYDCEKLSSIDCPELTAISKYAFANVPLTSINCPKIISIDQYGFMGSKFTSIYCPNVTSIGRAAFANNTTLQSICLSGVDSVTEIYYTFGDYAFSTNNISVYVKSSLSSDFENNENWKHYIDDKNLKIIGV